MRPTGFTVKAKPFANVSRSIVMPKMKDAEKNWLNFLPDTKGSGVNRLAETLNVAYCGKSIQPMK